MINWLTRHLGKLRPCAGGWWESEIVGVCKHGAPWGSGGFPSQPINAYSNAAYPLAGWVAHLLSGTAESLVVALTMTALGVGSFLYHAWPTVKSAKYDHAGMYAVFLALSTYAAGGPAWAMAIAAAVGAYAFRFAFSMDLNAMMGLFLWISSIGTWASGGQSHVLVSWGFFVAAMAVWQLDRRRLWTGRWGHGLWHVLTAVAIAVMFLGVGT